MSERNLAEISAKINEMLETLDSPEERIRVLQSSMTLYGGALVQASAKPSVDNGTGTPLSADITEQDFFSEKQPKTSAEKLAVAARYREIRMGENTHSSKEMREFFSTAREDFVGNYGRDIDNARNRGFFTKKGKQRDTAVLSAYGQKFVDALPDRAAADDLPVPKKQSKKKKVSRKIDC